LTISAVYNVDTNQIKSNNLIFNTNDYKQKKQKIVATLGPACSTREIIKDMIDAGVNVFRVNFSHADYADVKEKIKIIRDLNDEYGYTTAILGDLQGPKFA
jgi:pyruvate kinase